MSRLRTPYYQLTTSLWNSRLAVPGRDDGDSINIIDFHGVHTAAMSAQAAPPTSSVSAESFEANVRGLLRYYQVISLSDAVAMLRGTAPWRARCAVLTFDDSLKCTVDVAFGILERLGATATIFLSTAAIDGRPYWWLCLDYLWMRAAGRRVHVSLAGADGEPAALECGSAPDLVRLKRVLRTLGSVERDNIVSALELQAGTRLEDPVTQYPHACPLTWADARGVVARGFEVGSHSVSHANLTVLSEPDLRAELVNSKTRIERALSIECRHFSYPYGAHTSHTSSLVEACGYEAAVTTVAPGRNQRGCDAFALRRYSVSGRPHKLPYVLSGAADFLALARDRLRRGIARPVNAH